MPTLLKVSHRIFISLLSGRKKISVALMGLLLVMGGSAHAATTLAIGDIAFTRVNIDGDAFSFVFLAPIDNGTTFYITDEAWNGSSLESGLESELLFTATSNISAGEEVSIDPGTLGVSFFSGGTLGTIASVGAKHPITNPSVGMNMLGAAGDNLFIHQGTQGAPAVGDFITGVFANSGVAGSPGNAWALSGTSTVSNSLLPSSLTNGTNAIGLLPLAASDIDNMRYKAASTHSGDKATILAAIMTPANWEFHDGTAYAVSATAFSVTTPTAATTTAAAFNTTTGTNITPSFSFGFAGETLTVGTAAHLAGSTASAAGGTDVLALTNGGDLSGLATLSGFETLTLADGFNYTMNESQHDSFTTITGAGTAQIVLATSDGDDVVTGSSTVDGYILNDVYTFTLGAAGQHVTGNGGASQSVNVAGLTATGTLNGGSGGTDTLKISNGGNISAATVSNFEVLDVEAANGTVTMSTAQLNAFTSLGSPGSLIRTISLNTSGTLSPKSLYPFNISTASGGSETITADAATLNGRGLIAVDPANDKFVVTGSSGGQTIKGSAGSDTIDGGAGADTIIPGFGTDMLTGGSENDRFLSYLNNGGDLHGDTITDIAVGDTIYFSVTSTIGAVRFGAGNNTLEVDIGGTDFSTIELTVNMTNNPGLTLIPGLSIAEEMGEYDFTISFSAIDVTGPTLNSSSPADGATTVVTNSNIVLTFDENIVFGTGNIQVIDVTDASNSFTIDAASPGGQASISGAVLTINPSVSIDDSSNYAVQIAATAIDDTSGNSYAGITNNTTLDFTTADETAPTLNSSSPADGATVIVTSSNIVLTFDENIAFGTGNIQVIDVTDGSNSFTIDAASPGGEASISGAVLTINPSSSLDDSANYAVQIAATAIDDASGNSFVGITNNTTLDFTTADETAPTLNSSSPSDGATVIVTSSNIVLTFDENIAFGTGNIQVIDVTDGSNSFTIDAASPGGQASISGAVLTINPSVSMDDSSNYAVQVAATAIDDASGNSYAGITNNTTLDFTTADETAPTLNSSSPTDGATAIAIASNIVLTFDENIAFGTGNIQVIDVTNGSNSFTIDAASPGGQASISGAVLTINPSSSLDDSANYAVQIATTALDDSSGNSYAGITNNTTLDFTTVDSTAPTLSSSSPADGATAIATNSNLVLTFDENIVFGTGSIQVVDVTDGSSSFTIDAALPGALASISGAVLTINPASDLDEVTNYAVQIAATALDDSNGNSFAGITGNTVLDFTSADETAPTLTITMSASALSNGATATVTFTFSETPVGFVVGDASTVENGALSAFAVDGSNDKIYTATFTPTGGVSDATNVISVLGSSYTDGEANPGSNASSPNYTISDSSVDALTKVGAAATGGDASGVTIADLNAISGVSGAIAGNLSAYQAAIAAAAAADVDDAAKIQVIITSINALEEVKAAAVAGDASGITFTELNDITGVSSALSANEAAYQSAIAASADVDSAAKIEALIVSVNVVEEVKAAATANSATGVTFTELNAILQSNNAAITGNEAAYQTAIAALTSADVETAAKIIALVKQINAIEVIKAYADNNTSTAPTASDYFDVGIVGVTSGNLADANQLIDDLASTDVDSAAKIKTVIASVLLDTDGDKIGDEIDADDDNDGIADSYEKVASTKSTTSLAAKSQAAATAEVDTDGDGIADNKDADSDNDGIPDSIEYLGVSAVDVDGDGKVDSFVDANGDGLADASSGQAPVDTDGDGLPDYRDTDSDGDGKSDLLETAGPILAALLDKDGDGVIDNTTDADKDGQPDVVDPSNTKAAVGNKLTPLDTDGDGISDQLDKDSDNDGTPDSVDVRTSTSPDVSSGKSGVTANGLLMLLGLLGLSLLRLRRGAVVLLGLMLSSLAGAADLPIELEIGMGHTHFDPELQTPFVATDDVDPSYAIALGYRLHNNWLAQLRYSDLGRVEVGTAHIDYQAVSLNVQGELTITESGKVRLFGLLGVANLQQKATGLSVQEDNTTEAHLGAGIKIYDEDVHWGFELSSYNESVGQWQFVVGTDF